MEDKIFISKFLDIEQPIDEAGYRFSTMAMLLRSARKLSGRNLLSGEYQHKEFYEKNIVEDTYLPFMFTGLMNYLIILEQIGSIFRPKNRISGSSNGIYLALEYYSDFNEDKVNAIKALRNTLTHKFGLATENKEDKSYKFQLNTQRSNDIIIPANWNGDFSDKSQDTLTIVYVIDLADLIERIYHSVKENWDKDELEMICKGGLNELKARYTVTH